MMLGKPRDEKVESPPSGRGAHVFSPSGPVPHQGSESEQTDDVAVGAVLEQPDGRPALIELPDGTLACEQGAEL